MNEQVEQTAILYIEDDAGLGRLVQKRLSRAGQQVELARDGAEGLAKLKSSAYSLVIVDYNLPGQNGLDVMRSIMEQCSIPPAVIMLTGAGNETLAVEAMKLGASDYVVKDAEAGYLNLLPTLIERSLERRRLMEAKKQWEIEREQLILELQEALAKVKRLGGLLPICASCKKIRDDQGYWNRLEVFLHEHSEAEFTHSICPECFAKLYGNLTPKQEEENNL
ncbi:MAG TPA: response regulator [Candidatus Hydrogenedentes bacterium]|nr:response regulator [Candidatus Hydrogenedentota bacterium]